jgi:hypothetical protein
MKLKYASLATVLITSLFSMAYSQNNGRLSGYVKDVFGEALEGASVVLINTDSGRTEHPKLEKEKKAKPRIKTNK